MGYYKFENDGNIILIDERCRELAEHTASYIIHYHQYCANCHVSAGHTDKTINLSHAATNTLTELCRDDFINEVAKLIDSFDINSNGLISCPGLICLGTILEINNKQLDKDTN